MISPTAGSFVCGVLENTCGELLANCPESQVGTIQGWIRLYRGQAALKRAKLGETTQRGGSRSNMNGAIAGALPSRAGAEEYIGGVATRGIPALGRPGGGAGKRFATAA